MAGWGTATGTLIGAGTLAATIYGLFLVQPEATIRVVRADIDGSRIALELRNPGRDSAVVKRVEFKVIDHTTAAPDAVPAVLRSDGSGRVDPSEETFDTVFPEVVRPGETVLVDVGYSVAASESGAFTVKVSIPPGPRGSDPLAHVYRVTAVLVYNEDEHKVALNEGREFSISAIAAKPKMQVTVTHPDREAPNSSPNPAECLKRNAAGRCTLYDARTEGGGR